ncbi:nucleopolyhedrovirus P10 family protein [Streptomyces sp. NPDC005202]|uniref:nucleopolyhedrovirus P10 family protein n=1 Tax=Streptomyces sp. NPDC005202 TaxID=3157021 RepID=UPI00339E926B
MTADGWTRTVRHQLALGRLLPLGGPHDAAWIAERAAEAVLRRAAQDVPGVRLGALRVALADPENGQAPVVPPPPSALPPGPLRVSADLAATAVEPLPTTAARLRGTLAAAAAEALGLTVTDIDLRVTALLDEAAEPVPVPVRPPQPPTAEEAAADAGATAADADETRVAAVVLAVPGVMRLTGALGGLGRAVHIEERQQENALPRRHVRVEVAVRTDHRALDVTREIRTAVAEALTDHPTVAVLVTTVG